MTRTKSRSNGEGSVFKTTVRGQTVWRASFSIPRVVENAARVLRR